MTAPLLCRFCERQIWESGTTDDHPDVGLIRVYVDERGMTNCGELKRVILRHQPLLEIRRAAS